MALDTDLPELPDPGHPVARDRPDRVQVYIDADWYPVLKALIELAKEIKQELGQNLAFADLPAAAGRTGWRIFVTNGRKVGEGVGAGTGTLAYSDGTAWRRVADDTTVAA